MVDKEQIVTLTDGLLVRAPAKINLSLLISGKRPDGFHELETIMAKINWFDELLIQKGQSPGIQLICNGPEWAPDGEENIVYQAVKLLNENFDLPDLKITLTKNIPAGTGLGSASSDAAATLIGLNRFCQLALSKQKLLDTAAQLGSDVAFFIDGPLAFCTGKGEKIQKLTDTYNFLALLILPGINVSTKRVYENYKHDHTLYEKFSQRINQYIEKNSIDLITKICANMLEQPCFLLNEELAKLKQDVENLGVAPLSLSGSGSAMYCIIDNADEKKAKNYQLKLEQKLGCKTVLVNNNRW